MPIYGQNLRSLRTTKKLKQSDIAHILGTTQQVYSRYEKGLNALPVRHLVTLCQYFCMSADQFLGLDSTHPPQSSINKEG